MLSAKYEATMLTEVWYAKIFTSHESLLITSLCKCQVVIRDCRKLKMRCNWFGSGGIIHISRFMKTVRLV